MTTETMTVAQAIDASVCEDRVVRLTVTEGVMGDLLVECDDYADEGDERHYWGTTETGSAWCIAVSCEEADAALARLEV